MVHAVPSSVSQWPLLAALTTGILVAPLHAQTSRGEVRVEENLRAEPNGVVVAVLDPGMPLEVLQEQGNWMEVVVEGWIWLQSLRTRDGGAFDLQVTVSGGENLRDSPQGDVLARFEEGALLTEMDRIPGWARVQRRAWIWKASVRAGGSGGGARREPTPAPNLAGTFVAGASSAVLGSPDGDTLVLLRPGAELPVTGRQGNWARVRLDGWVWMPGGAVGESTTASGESPTLQQVLQSPEANVGRLVTWELQYVSLEEAEAVRTDFYEGEPFLLTRPVGSESTRFVYVAVPPEALAAARGLTPLERITIVGRVRTGASSLTGAPILDLVELSRGR